MNCNGRSPKFRNLPAVVFLTVTSTMSIASATNTETSPISTDSIRSVSTTPTWSGSKAIAGIDRSKHISDGVAYSSWVGDPADGPVGVDWKFHGTRYVSEVVIIPGCAGSNRTFTEFARPKTVTFEADGRTETVQLGDRRRPQAFQFDPPLRARAIRMNVVSTFPGKRDGVCLTEVSYREVVTLMGIDEATRELIDGHVSNLGTEKSPQAILGLETAGPAAIPAVTHALTSEDFDIQRDSLEVLRRLGSPGASDAVLAYWKKKPAKELVPLALGALAATGTLDALNKITELMSSEDFDVADAAADAAGGFGTAILPNLGKLLQSDYDDVVERSLRALSRVSSPDVVPLAAPYVKARFSSWRTAAAKALAASGSVAALPHLRLLSDDPHPSVRQAIASFADSFPPGEAQELLARLARDEDGAVARRALHNLAKDVAGVSYLAEYLREDVAPLGDMAIDLLVKKRTIPALNILIDALARGEARFRSALQEGVAAFGPAGVTALFHASLKDQRLKVDARALLVKFPNLALSLVRPLVVRNPSDVDTALLDTLGRAQATGSLAVMDHVFAAGSLSGKIAVAKAWAYFPASVVSNRILGAVRHPDPMVRREAAISGSKAGVRELAPILTKALEDKSVDADIVVMALARLKDGSIEAYMLERFRDSDASMSMRLAVLHACKELQTPECIRTLYSAANDANLTIRHEALLLLQGDDRLAQLY